MKTNSFQDWEKVLIAVQDGEIAGFCVFEHNGNVPEKFDNCHPFINSVFADEKYRGHRISESLSEK
ncbi:MAG: GNAT family N-acetyltransferase, partial [Solobacterium sp.]|nr:GNAT family N-acetyltransferase [Solobacterium sp.]